MKNLYKSMLIVLALVLNQACSSDDNGNPSGSSNITATIDGQSWASINGAGIAQSMNFTMGDENYQGLQILGVSMDLSSIAINIPMENFQVGTYTTDVMITYTSVTGMSNFEIYSSFLDEGNSDVTVTITNINYDTRTITGTFSGTLTNTMGTSTVSITNGSINNVNFASTLAYSGGSMSLSKDGGDVFTMGDNPNSPLHLLISEVEGVNPMLPSTIVLTGYNATLSADAGIYMIHFPKNVQPGSYNLATDNGFSAGFSNTSDESNMYTLNSGTLTITANNANQVTGTFNYQVSNNTTTVNITQGSFNVTLQ